MAVKHISKNAYLAMTSREARLNAWIKQHPENDKDVSDCDFAWCDGELISFPNKRFEQKCYEAYFKRRFNEVVAPSQRDWSKKEKPPMKFNKTSNVDVPVGYRLTKMTPHESFMYKVLDDIDTASDIAKSNDKLFRILVRNAITKFKNGRMFCCDGEAVKKIVPTKAYIDKWNRKLDEMMADYQ